MNKTKIYISVSFLLFISGINISYSQLAQSSPSFVGQARIQEHFPKFDDKIDARRFACDAKDRTEGIAFSEIVFLNKDTLQIINHTPSPSFGGVIIKILIDSNLNVISIIYSEWTDEHDGLERDFSVESPSVLLNFNPFTKGITGLQGRYNFIIKTDYTPNETLKNRGIEASTDFRLFFGRFKCG